MSVPPHPDALASPRPHPNAPRPPARAPVRSSRPSGEHPDGARTTIAPDDPRLRFRGAVSLQHGDGWVAPWRVPHEEARLHLPAGGLGRAAMPAGVRIALRTDARELTLRYRADPAPVLNGPQEAPHLDLVVDGALRETVVLRPEQEEDEVVLALPGRRAAVELWLPTYHQFRLVGLAVDGGATIAPDDAEAPPWVHDGSSISQGRGAASPSRAWPAQVARRAGLDLTSLALGAACHLQPMTARTMRDRPAALLSACVGINSQALGALNAETFAAAIIGFVRTVRDRHPQTPFVVVSTTFAPDREDVPGPSGLTIRDCRRIAADAVGLLRRHGDAHVHHLSGLDLFGPADAHLFLEPEGVERLHPAPAGHDLVADRFVDALGRLGVLPASL